MAQNFPTSPSNGDTFTVNGVVFVYNSTKGVWAKQGTTIPPLVTGHVLPDTSLTYDLGSADKKFRDLYLDGNTLNIGNQTIRADANGVIVTGRVAAGSLELGTGGSINAQLTTLDFTNTTVNFSGASISGLDDTVQDEVDFHLNKNNSGGTTIISDGEILSWNATSGLQGTGDYEWIAPTSTSSTVTLSQQGTLSITTGTARWYAPANITIPKITARLAGTATGSTVAVVKVDGVTEKTITIASGSSLQADTTGFTMTDGEYITIDLTSVGTTPGTGLTVQFIYSYT